MHLAFGSYWHHSYMFNRMWFTGQQREFYKNAKRVKEYKKLVGEISRKKVPTLFLIVVIGL